MTNIYLSRFIFPARGKCLSFLLLLPLLVFSQSQDQNYVKTTTYKVPTATSITAPTTLEAVENVTYLDGLGRPAQQVAHRQSATGQDIITHIEYDGFGRQSTDFLPYASTQDNMQYIDGATLRGDVISQYQSLYDSDNPFSEKRFEMSPLGRVLEQAAPGNDWRLSISKHTIKLDYQTNAENEVKFYKALASGTNLQGDGYYATSLSANGYYPKEQLYKTTTRDENCTYADLDGGITEEFRDKKGHIVLRRTYGESIVDGVGSYGAHDTYYVYDQYGNLSYVIPPLAGNPMEQLDGLCYQYRYDYRNRLVEKKLPGKRWEYMVYDKLDRLAATSQASSPFSDIHGTGWVITKYDAFGRPILTGWITGRINSAARKAFQDGYMLPSSRTSETRVGASNQVRLNAITIQYTNVAYPTQDFEVLTVNYYDDYAIADAPHLPTDVEGQQVLGNTRGLLTSTLTRVLESTGDGRAQVGFIFYDQKSRPISNLTSNYLGGYTQVDSRLDFTGRALYTITTHKRNGTSDGLKVRDDYSYTDQDRLLLHWQTLNDSQVQLIARNEYDELGRLVAKHVGGDDIDTSADGLQKVDYTYNIRGWLTGINNTDDLADTPADLFAFRISYNTITGDAPGVMPLYNGNISETFWRSASDNVLRKYGYRYDNLNRLREGIYQKPAINPQVDSYNESVAYDKNGNITSLSRDGDLDDQSYSIGIDRLAYEYSHQYPNRLMKVTDDSLDSSGFKDDTAPEGTDDYAYDSNGNMVQDANKGIETITYNHLNLPTGIVFAGTTSRKIDYIYDASGQKLAKTVTIGSQTFVDDYLDGFQYSNGSLSFFPTAEGYVRNTVVDGQDHFNYVFNYTDHLGNIRMSYGIDPETNVLKIMQENHYYPFGLKHAKYNTVFKDFGKEPNSNNIALKQIVDPGDGNPVDEAHFGTYQYKYNGKEYQDELGLNVYDYENRTYDPADGRWWQMDPMAEQGRRWSPYAYAMNNPVYFLDPDGMWPDNPISDWINKARSAVKSTISNAVGYVATRAVSAVRTAIGNTSRSVLNALTPSITIKNPFTKAKPEKAEKGGGSGVSFTTEGGKSGGLVTPEGDRDTKTMDMSVLIGLTDIYGAPTKLPGVAPDGSDPLNTPTGEAPANESTMSTATSSETDNKIKIEIPVTTFDVGANSKSANHHTKDTIVNKKDSAKVTNEALKKDKLKTDNFNKKYGTNF